MLYEEIWLGCEMYHSDEHSYDEAYKDYMLGDKDRSKWDQPEKLDSEEARKVITFINRWKTRTPMRTHHLLPALRKAVPSLNLLRGKTILDVDFMEIVNSMRTEQLIENCFDILASCGPRYESVGTSKILHTINPELFVIPIRRDCAVNLMAHHPSSVIPAKAGIQ